MYLALIIHLTASACIHEGGFIFPPNAFHNHGSSIVETAQGDLIAAWFHGTGERGADDVCIQGARKRAGEVVWSEPFVMADTPDLPDCNPVLFIDPRGVLWLFWITVQDNLWGGSLLKYRTASRYDGEGPPDWDWQDVIHTRPQELETRFLNVIDSGLEIYGEVLETLAPDMKKEVVEVRERAQQKLHQRLGWMTRTPPIMLSDSLLMLGLYSDVYNCSLAAFTADWGKTWQFSHPIMDDDVMMLGNIQPCFARRKNGEIVAYMRDNGLPKQVRSSVSTDNGMTWGAVQTVGIANPGSSVDVEVLQSGCWALVCNDVMVGRHRLVVYLSEDEGASWKWSYVIEETEEDKGSFSYPAVIQSRDGNLHVTYSFKKEGIEGSTIKHGWFNEEWIKSNCQTKETGAAR